MAIKINNVTVITDNEELDCSNSSIIFLETTTATLPSTNNVDGDTVFNRDTNELMVFWNGSWISGSGGFRARGGDRIEEFNGSTYHIFTSPGNFEVKQGDNTTFINYTLIGGGGGGGRQGGGGGGAGQVITSTFPDAYFTSTNNNTCVVTVGNGGAGGRVTPGPGQPGENSSLFFQPSVAAEILAQGGGGGGSLDTSDPTSSKANAGRPGASGGGGGSGYRIRREGGVATNPTGNPGGMGNIQTDVLFVGGGGGSPIAKASNAPNRAGGIGALSLGILGLCPSVGTPGPDPNQRYFAGGGNGTGWVDGTDRPDSGGAGGSTGSGNIYPVPQMAPQLPKTNAFANTGSGGGGRSWNSPDSGFSNGGSGIAILHYVTPT